ncbi:MAG: ShlB/FhaC/HecB family hemolysin secretion/activation protein [Azonexus sp.]
MSRLCLALLGVGCNAVVIAATPEEIGAARRQAEIIQQQQRDILRQDQERANRIPVEGGSDLGRFRVAEPESSAGAECREVNEIAIEGGDLLERSMLDRFQHQFVGRCLSTGDIEKILSLITNHYVERGFITTRAYLPPQDLSKGRLVILVIEGVIEELRKEGGDTKRIFIPGAFPTSSGDKLNLRDLEQGIEQINRLSSNSATMDIQPGSAPGKSIVVIRNKATFPAHVNLAYDNMGSSSTGKESVFMGAVFDSLLGLNERLMLSGRHSYPDNNEHSAYMRAFDFSIPYGRYSLGMNVSRNSYVNFLSLPSGAKLETTGRTDSQALSIDRVLLSNQRGRLSLNTKLTAQESSNYIGNQLSETSSRKLSALSVAVSGGAALLGGSVFGQVEYSKGLKLFGALRDPDQMTSDMPRAQYEKFNVDLSYTRPISSFSFSTQMSAQYSSTPLYGSQQILIGSPSSVRGFLETSISGDCGYFFRNELRYPMVVQQVSGFAYIGYDFGHVWGLAKGSPTGSLSGSTVGFTAHWRGLNLEVFRSNPLERPSSMRSEPSRIWLRVSSAF